MRCAPAAASAPTRSARAEARSWPSDLNTDLLGQVPLDERLRECGDSGEPLVLSQPDSPAAVAIADIAATLADRLAPKVPAAARIKRPLTVL